MWNIDCFMGSILKIWKLIGSECSSASSWSDASHAWYPTYAPVIMRVAITNPVKMPNLISCQINCNDKCFGGKLITP